jgi:hypothetical protein
MNDRDLELALKKQRLQMRSEELRRQIGERIAAASPLLTGAAKLRDAFAWLRAHPLLPIAVAIAYAVARPGRAWRWGRRAFTAWQLLKRIAGWIAVAAGSRKGDQAHA